MAPYRKKKLPLVCFKPVYHKCPFLLASYTSIIITFSFLLKIMLKLIYFNTLYH